MRPRHHDGDVRTAPERRWRRPGASTGDRAQLILVSALVLATTLVALSLVVNSVIYTENLATRRDADTGGALNFQDASKVGALESLETANYGTNDQTYLQRKSTLRDSLAAWKASTSRFFAREGLEVDARATGFVEGTRVSQDSPDQFLPVNEDVRFSNNELDLLGLGSEETWLLADGTDVRRLQLQVERDDRLVESGQDFSEILLETILTGYDPYAFQVTDATGDTYQVYVYEDTTSDPNQVGVAVYDVQAEDWVEDTCLAPGDSVTIDVTGGRLVGDAGAVDCPALAFWDELEGPYDLYHVNGNSVTGTYSFLSDQSEDEFRQAVEDRNNGNLYDDITDLLAAFTGSFSASDTYHSSSTSGDPYTNTAIYAVDVDTKYETADIAYQSSARIAPGEPTAATPADTGAGAWGTGTDNAAPDAEYTIDSETVVVGNPISVDASGSSDPDGSIQRFEWSFGDGAADRGTTESHTYSSTGTYAVTLTVTDDEGATDSRTRTVHVVSSDDDAPVVDSVTPTDTSSSGPDADTVQYEVDWTVSDDEELAEVRVRLVADPGGSRSVLDSAAATVEGTSATSTLTVGGPVVDGCGESYEVVVTVEDATGMTDRKTEGVTASC